MKKRITGANLTLALKENNKKIKEYVDNSQREIKQYQRYVNTDLDYGLVTILSDVTNVTLNMVIPFDTIRNTNNINFDIANNSFHLKANKTYKIESLIRYCSVESFIYYGIYDVTNNKWIQDVTGITETTNNGWDASTPTCTIITTTEDVDIQIKITEIGAITTGLIHSATSYFEVQEINRQITIDPVEHINTTQGIEDVPVGHIISHMGTVAPKHYLICDGTEYNITDYPYLAQHIEDNFGSVNYFGGNGVNTFAVPLEEKEYVWNKNATLTSATQYSYYSPSNAFDDNASSFWHSDTPQGSDEWIQVDFGKKIALSVLKVLPRSGYANQTMKNFKIQGSNDGITYNDLASFTDITEWTSNVYNTFILKETAYYSIYRIYITAMNDVSVTISDLMFGSTKGATYIKYEPTYFMNTYNTNYMQPSMYSEEERIVGCWIDGKPLYEKTIKTTIPLKDTRTVIANLPENIDYVTISNCYAFSETSKMSFNFVFSGTNGNNGNDCVWISLSEGIMMQLTSGINISLCYVTIQYTKTTDEENSFTNDMLKDSYVELTYSDEEIYNEVASILSSESNKGE